jgi:hypothetical protein
LLCLLTPTPSHSITHLHIQGGMCFSCFCERE